VLLQAMPHLASMDLIVARAAESGASRVVPFVARRSPLEAVRKSSGRITRWQAIARESSKLSRRPWPLEVRTAVDGFIDKDLLVTVGCCLVFWEEESRALSNSLPDRPPRSLGIVIGPEGGFEPAEVDGCRTASLGDLNITSEGAGSYAAMLVRYHYGLLCPEVPPGE
jgi:16S rRNA (uracil1498-N3)-methyltransferase